LSNLPTGLALAVFFLLSCSCSVTTHVASASAASDFPASTMSSDEDREDLAEVGGDEAEETDETRERSFGL
jgi:hypothetical protein